MTIINRLDSNKSLFFNCNCKSEVLCIDYDHNLNVADISIFENSASFQYKRSYYQRLRYALHILLYGKPYTDQIILDKKQLKELKSFLSTLDL